MLAIERKSILQWWCNSSLSYQLDIWKRSPGKEVLTLSLSFSNDWKSWFPNACTWWKLLFFTQFQFIPPHFKCSHNYCCMDIVKITRIKREPQRALLALINANINCFFEDMVCMLLVGCSISEITQCIAWKDGVHLTVCHQNELKMIPLLYGESKQCSFCLSLQWSGILTMRANTSSSICWRT